MAFGGITNIFFKIFHIFFSVFATDSNINLCYLSKSLLKMFKYFRYSSVCFITSICLSVSYSFFAWCKVLCLINLLSFFIYSGSLDPWLFFPPLNGSSGLLTYISVFSPEIPSGISLLLRGIFSNCSISRNFRFPFLQPLWAVSSLPFQNPLAVSLKGCSKRTNPNVNVTINPVLGTCF